MTVTLARVLVRKAITVKKTCLLKPPKGSTAAHSFWSSEDCDTFFKESSPTHSQNRCLSTASSWIFLAKLTEDPTKNKENQVESGGVENMPKISQEVRNIIQKLSVIQHGLQKTGSYPESLLGGCGTIFGCHFFEFWAVLAPKMAPCWRPRRDGAKIDKKTMRKSKKFESHLEGHNFEISSIFEANMEAGSHQNRRRNQC